MATTTPFRTSPAVGPDLSEVVKADQAWYDPAGKGIGGTGQAMSPQTGTVEIGNNGRLYMWVKASAAVTVAAAPGTQLTLTVGADGYTTAAAGTGGWYAPTTAYYTGTIAAGDCFWAAKGIAP